MKVLIADDHALFRDGLSMQLEKLNADSVVFQAGSFSQALKILSDEKKLDLIIVDLDMPDMGWEEGLAAIRQHAGGARYVIISASENPRDIRKSLDAGASGYIPKRSEPKILASALQLVLDGGTYLPPSVLEPNPALSGSERNSATAPVSNGKNLTPRQLQVLGFVAQGMSNKQIAYEIGVSEATVKLHINALLRSVGATNRTQALIMAQKMGLI